MQEEQKGRLIIISGPAGSGKDAVVNELLGKRKEIKRLVTYTSRPIGTGEVDGVDYHFVPKEVFEERISAGFFAEYVVYRINADGTPEYKGTAMQDLIEVIEEGSKVVWRIDMSRASEIDNFFRNNMPEVAEDIIARKEVILIGVESLTTLKQRAINRTREYFDEAKFRRTLKKDLQVWRENRRKFKVVINRDGQLAETVKNVEDIIDSPTV